MAAAYQQRHGYGFARPLTVWHDQHSPLARDYLAAVRGDEPMSKGVKNEVRRATGHPVPSPLTSLEDLTCLPWVRMPGSMDRLFL